MLLEQVEQVHLVYTSLNRLRTAGSFIMQVTKVGSCIFLVAFLFVLYNLVKLTLAASRDNDLLGFSSRFLSEKPERRSLDVVNNQPFSNRLPLQSSQFSKK